MSDFDGAVRLYRQYGSDISFGIHLNMTEGHPLLHNDCLIQAGLLKESATGGGILLNANWSRYKYLSKDVKNGIFEEFDTQIIKVLDSGIRISHIDSHHHIHNGFCFLPIVVALAKKYKIRKIRNIRNFIPFSASRVFRSCWTTYMKCLYPRVITTDWFISYSEFLARYGKFSCRRNSVIELMCHPGGVYPEEEEMMVCNNITNWKNFECINYNQL